MAHTVSESENHMHRRATLRRAAPFVVLAALVIAFGMHPYSSLERRDVGISLAVLAAIAVAAALTLQAHLRPRRLPVVTLEPGTARVRPIEPSDLDLCAALHAETLPHGFFAGLGRRFLRAYLATFLASPHAVALLVKAGETPVGMIVGILRPGAHTRWVVRHRGVRLALLAGLALATRPRLAVRFARTRISRYRRAWSARKTESPAEPAGRPAVLSHVAVAPAARGAGLGAQLVDAFVDAARAAGCGRVVLVTLAGDGGAAGFYLRQGWIESGLRRDFDGEPMIELTLPLLPEER